MKRLLVRGHQGDLSLLLREEVVRNHWHREASAAGLAIGVGRRGILHCSSRAGKSLALIREDIRVGTGVCRGS